MAFLLALSLAASALPASAQIAMAPPADGAYEHWSATTMTAVGPLAGTPQGARWIEVRSTGRTALVTFQPEGRVVWRITYGPHGPTTKTIEVDGQPFATSRFTYDASGHVVRKVAGGPGLPAPVTWDYTTDPQGRVLTRRTMVPPGTLARARGATAPVVDLQTTTYRRDRTDVVTSIDGAVVRRDRYDARGLLTETRWESARDPRHPIHLALTYRRDASGALLGVRRTIDGRTAPTDPTARDPAIDSRLIAALTIVPIERHEVLLLYGAPHTSSDTARGASRRIADDYSDGCWMNDLSALEYDATGLLVAADAPCICGFCVDAELAVDEPIASIEGTDLHFTSGPWVRLDGSIDVTIEHRVITPRGPVPAGELRAGDVVIASDGTERTLRSVELLPDRGERLGRNVRTADGTFGAGGILFESEVPRACPPP